VTEPDVAGDDQRELDLIKGRCGSPPSSPAVLFLCLLPEPTTPCVHKKTDNTHERIMALLRIGPSDRSSGPFPQIACSKIPACSQKNSRCRNSDHLPIE
jgi:hypothetical protein